MKHTLRRTLLFLFAACLVPCLFSGCTKREPVTLTMWHVYGSQTESPMNELVDVFNATVGEKEGITINVTSVSNSTAIHDALVASAAKEPGAGELPDIFVCYPKTAAKMGGSLLMDWGDRFTDEELDEYVSAFVDEGVLDGRLVVFPIAKSSEVIFINTTVFDRFSADTGVTYADLATYEGFFDAAARYAEWSGGSAFFQYDDWLNYALINTASLGGELLSNETLNLKSAPFMRVWAALSNAASKGGVCTNDGYSTTSIMTGAAVCGIESTASILYFKDTVTYPDNETEPLTLRALPVPVFSGAEPLVVQRGVGLCALAGDANKERAAAVFCKWLTETDNNLGFVTTTGYMPVKKTAFDALFSPETTYKNDSYASLYEVIGTQNSNYTYMTPPVFDGYGDIEKSFSEALKAVLRGAKGKTAEQTLSELITALR